MNGQFTVTPLFSCAHCGSTTKHAGTCPRIMRIEYHDGQIAAVEYFRPIDLVVPDAPKDEKLWRHGMVCNIPFEPKHLGHPELGVRCTRQFPHDGPHFDEDEGFQWPQVGA